MPGLNLKDNSDISLILTFVLFLRLALQCTKLGRVEQTAHSYDYTQYSANGCVSERLSDF